MKPSNIKPYLDLGGLNLVLFKIEDKITHKNSAGEYQYRIMKNAEPDEYPKLLSAMYKIVTGEKLDLSDPLSFNEKVQWMKLYDSTPEKTKLADKYIVREWVEKKIGSQYLIPLLGAWDSFGDIDFEMLPDAFVMKCNHGSGMNLVVTEKDKLDLEKTKTIFDGWMDTDYAFINGLELHYSNITRKIIAEKYIAQMDKDLIDYKIHVFNGEPGIVELIGDRDLKKHTGKYCFMTPEWKYEELSSDAYELYDTIPEKPENLDEMLRIARILGEEFRYVRVDLYNIEGRILFGEMTFTPSSGFGKWGGADSIFSRLMD